MQMLLVQRQTDGLMISALEERETRATGVQTEDRRLIHYLANLRESATETKTLKTEGHVKHSRHV